MFFYIYIKMSILSIIGLIVVVLIMVTIIGAISTKATVPGKYRLYTVNGNEPLEHLKKDEVDVQYEDATGNLIITIKSGNSIVTRTVESPTTAVLLGTNYKEDIDSVFYISMITGRIKNISKNEENNQYVTEYEKIEE
jgi:hypothetical protein